MYIIYAMGEINTIEKPCREAKGISQGVYTLRDQQNPVLSTVCGGVAVVVVVAYPEILAVSYEKQSANESE